MERHAYYLNLQFHLTAVVPRTTRSVLVSESVCVVNKYVRVHNRVIANFPQYKNANIGNFALAVPFKINKTNVLITAMYFQLLVMIQPQVPQTLTLRSVQEMMMGFIPVLQTSTQELPMMVNVIICVIVPGT